MFRTLEHFANRDVVEELSMEQTLEIDCGDEVIRLELHHKRRIPVLRIGERQSMTFDVPLGGSTRLVFSRNNRIELADGWTGIHPATISGACILTKVTDKGGDGWYILTTHNGIWGHPFEKRR